MRRNHVHGFMIEFNGPEEEGGSREYKQFRQQQQSQKRYVVSDSLCLGSFIKLELQLV